MDQVLYAMTVLVVEGALALGWGDKKSRLKVDGSKVKAGLDLVG